jgi:hypothetical protein
LAQTRSETTEDSQPGGSRTGVASDDPWVVGGLVEHLTGCNGTVYILDVV